MNALYEILPLDKILDPTRPLRNDLSPESVVDLVASIKQIGIIEPLVVCRSGDSFEVIAGHRRLMAAEVAGLALVPCLITEVTGIEAEILKLHENIARAEINPIDWAKHLHYLKSQYGLTTAKLAELLGMSPDWVAQHLAILQYPEELLEALATDKIAFSAARELVQIKDQAKRKMHVDYAVRGGVSPALAAKWRREANLESLPQTAVAASTEGEGVFGSLVLPDMICPVCNDVIPMQEAVTMTVHISCRPVSS